MTIQDVIDYINSVRSNAYPDEAKITWISTVDAMIREQILQQFTTTTDTVEEGQTEYPVTDFDRIVKVYADNYEIPKTDQRTFQQASYYESSENNISFYPELEAGTQLRIIYKERLTPYDVGDLTGTTLLAPIAYQKLYTHYIFGMMNYFDQKYDEYNNDIELFNAAFNDFYNAMNPLEPEARGQKINLLFTDDLDEDHDYYGTELNADLLDGELPAYYLEWGNFTGIPSTFPPSSHTHPINQVTGLQSELDGKLDPSDIGDSVQPYDADTVIDASYVHTDNNYTTTEKNKLSGIENNAEVNNISDANATDLTNGEETALHKHDDMYLAKDNETAFTPDEDYEPATKKYVDDSVSSAGGGDMLKTVYDPTSIEGDAFDRSNHTGTQTASTISDFDAEVADNSAVSANTAKVSFPEAPEDGEQYVRQDAEWVAVTATGLGAYTSISPSGSDDVSAIESALNGFGAEGGTLVMQAGTFLIGSAIDVPSHCVLVGNGEVTLQRTGTGYAVFDLSDAQNVHIRSLRLNHNQYTGATDYGFYIANTTSQGNHLIEDLMAYGGGSNFVYGENIDGLRVIDGNINGTADASIEITNSRNILIDKNQFNGNGSADIISIKANESPLVDVENIKVTHNHIKNSDEHAVGIEAVASSIKDVIVSNNILEHSGLSAILLKAHTSGETTDAASMAENGTDYSNWYTDQNPSNVTIDSDGITFDMVATEATDVRLSTPNAEGSKTYVMVYTITNTDWASPLYVSSGSIVDSSVAMDTTTGQHRLQFDTVASISFYNMRIKTTGADTGETLNLTVEGIWEDNTTNFPSDWETDPVPPQVTVGTGTPEYPTLSLPAVTDSVTLSEAEDIISWQHQIGKESEITAESVGAWGDVDGIFTRAWNGSEDLAHYYTGAGDTIAMGFLDDGCTTNAIRKVAVAYDANPSETDLRDAIRDGIDFLLRSQTPSGGFPEVYPENDYAPAYYENQITFNDDTMRNVIRLFRRVLDGIYPYDNDAVTESQKSQIQVAYDNAIQCVLNCQLTENGVRTGWAGSYTEAFEPTWQRYWEPDAAMGLESIHMLEYLLTIPAAQRSESMKVCIHEGIEWIKATDKVGWTFTYQSSPGEGYFTYTGDPSDHLWHRFVKWDGDSWEGYYGISVDNGTYTFDDISKKGSYGWGHDSGEDHLLNISGTPSASPQYYLSDFQISGNQIEDFAINAVAEPAINLYDEQASQAIVQGIVSANVIRGGDNTGSGILADGIGDTNLTDNVISGVCKNTSDSQDGGIAIKSCKTCVVSDNVMKDIGGGSTGANVPSGIALTESNYCVVSGNVIDDTDNQMAYGVDENNSGSGSTDNIIANNMAVKTLNGNRIDAGSTDSANTAIAR